MEPPVKEVRANEQVVTQVVRANDQVVTQMVTQPNLAKNDPISGIVGQNKVNISPSSDGAGSQGEAVYQSLALVGLGEEQRSLEAEEIVQDTQASSLGNPSFLLRDQSASSILGLKILDLINNSSPK